MAQRTVCSILLAILLALLFAANVAAHAILVQSTPAAGSTVATAPPELVLEFTEELDPQFSSVQLLNSARQVVNSGPGRVEPAAPRILRLTLQSLQQDSYIAVFKARSAVDGHITAGNVPFGIGVPSAAALIPPADAPDPATLPPPLVGSVLRWLNLLAAAVALGSVPFVLLIWRPAFRSAPRDGADHLAADAAMTQSLRRLMVGGSALFLLATLVFLVAQAAEAAGVPFAQAIGAPAMQLMQGRSGQFLLARGICALALGLLAWRLRAAGQGPAWPWLAALVLTGAALLTFSLTGHNAAASQGAFVAVAIDWLHLAAMAAWLGGLVPLVIAVRAARRTPKQALALGPVAARFSRLAMTCVALLTATGIYSYMLQVNNLDLLAATTYGRALAVKLGLFGLLILLGVLNARILVPRLRALGNRLAGAFGWSVRAELIVGALVLLAVGVMTSIAPSVVSWEQHERLGVVQATTVDDVDLTLRVAPAQIGDNEFAVDVADKRPGAAGKPAKVLLRFDMIGMAMGQLQTEARPTGAERYVARGSFVPMGGRWHMTVVLRRAGFADVQHTFEMDILRAAGG